MYSKKIKYTDYNDVEREEEFLFDINKSELIKWSAMDGDYTVDKVIEQIANKNNNKQTLQIFEDLLRLAYGEKSLDGRRFIKSDEVYDNFKQTNAYDVLFMELVTNPNSAVEFITSIIPKEIGDEMRKELESEEALEDPNLNKAKDFLKAANNQKSLIEHDPAANN